MINDHYRLWECSESRRVGVDHTWSPSNVDGNPENRTRTIPRTEDRKHDLSIWLQAYDLYDPAAFHHPELIVIGELEGGV